MDQLKYVDSNRPGNWFSRAYAAFSATRLGRLISARVVRHPAWFHNLRAHPDVRLGGIPMRAAVVSDEAERNRLWTLADRVFAPYASYREDAAKANRSIPIVQLTPRG